MAMMELFKPILMPMWFWLLTVVAPVFIVLLVFIVILRKSPPQVKALLTAWIRKRIAFILASEDGTYDIVTPKMDAMGNLEVSKDEVYQEFRGNPISSKKGHLRGTGIPVFLGVRRKSIYTGADTLAMIEHAESGTPVEGTLKKLAEMHDLTIDIKDKKKKKEKVDDSVKEKVKAGLTLIDPKKLIHYFESFFDLDALFILLDKRYQAGIKAAGKPPKVFYVLIGAGFAIFMVILGMLMAGLL